MAPSTRDQAPYEIRACGHGLLNEALEDPSATLTLTRIKSKGELIEVVCQVSPLDGSSMRTQYPTLQRARHLFDTREDRERIVGAPIHTSLIRLQIRIVVPIVHRL
jgi:hypothetical protein